jgi:hypothetical protein
LRAVHFEISHDLKDGYATNTAMIKAAIAVWRFNEQHDVRHFFHLLPGGLVTTGLIGGLFATTEGECSGATIGEDPLLAAPGPWTIVGLVQFAQLEVVLVDVGMLLAPDVALVLPVLETEPDG